LRFRALFDEKISGCDYNLVQKTRRNYEIDNFKWSPSPRFHREFIASELAKAENRSSVNSMQLRRAVQNKMFPHFLAMLQWILLVISLAFNLNFSALVTGAVANGGLKAIMPFHLWMFFFPAVLCPLFYGIRREGIAERCIIGLSGITIFFSIVNISLHFVNDFVLLMRATEVVAWSLYNSMFSMSIYRISIVFLLPVLKRYEKVEREALHND